jgi:hypothetical protein
VFVGRGKKYYKDKFHPFVNSEIDNVEEKIGTHKSEDSIERLGVGLTEIVILLRDLCGVLSISDHCLFGFREIFGINDKNHSFYC